MTDKNTKALAAQYSLVSSGYAGLDGDGNVVDRRENALATPVIQNESLYIPPPKPVPLAKHNFWDKLKEKFPAEVEDFYTWLEQYQAEVNWTKLFYSPHAAANRDIKFFDLPVEMQVGVIIKFSLEKQIGLMPMRFDAADDIHGFFSWYNTKNLQNQHD